MESPGPGVEAADSEPLCLYAGEGVERIKEILPAAEIVRRLA